MTNPPFRTEVRRLRQGRGPAVSYDARDRHRGDSVDPAATGPEIDLVVAQLDPIRSRSSLLSSFAREASVSEPVRTAYAIRWLELGPGIAATGIARSRHRQVMRPLLRGRS